MTPDGDGRGSAAHPGGTSRRGLVAGLVLGIPVIAFGVRGVLVDAADTHPAELARWIVGAAVVHDLALLPLAGAAAWALRRATPPRAWPYVRTAALTIAVLGLVGWPFVRGYGEDPANPSLFPRDYGVGVLAAAAAVMLAASVAFVAASVVAARRRHPVRTRRTGPGSTPGR